MNAVPVLSAVLLFMGGIAVAAHGWLTRQSPEWKRAEGMAALRRIGMRAAAERATREGQA